MSSINILINSDAITGPSKAALPVAATERPQDPVYRARPDKAGGMEGKIQQKQ